MAKVTRFKFTHAQFERWRKRQKFHDEATANLALRISKNLKAAANAPKTMYVWQIIYEDLAELTARRINAVQS